MIRSMSFDSEIRMLAKKLRGARRVVALTGAGVSAESGVSTFRGPEGLWRKFRPEELATPQAFARDPVLVWEWYDWRRQKIAACSPNEGHRALAELGRRSFAFDLVTQNVDGPHRLPGAEPPLPLPRRARPPPSPPHPPAGRVGGSGGAGGRLVRRAFPSGRVRPRVRGREPGRRIP